MSKRLFANLGFLLQIAGLLTLLPIAIGFIYNESQAVISLFLACVTFLGSGFLLNAYCERKELDFKGSNFLFIITFILLPLIGSIPFFYANPFGSVPGSANTLEVFTNAYFESASGFTTTGFSLIAKPEALPLSILVYRSMTELMGGVGIVYLLLAFFQSRKSLSSLSNTFGIDNVSGSLKKTYFSVFAIYSVYILVFTGIFYALGFTDLISTGTFIIDTLTGGFTPSVDAYGPYLEFAPKFCIILLMLLGSVNFAFNYHLFTRKLKHAFSTEVFAYLIIIAVGTLALSLASNIKVLDSLFHVISMTSSTGQSYIPLGSFGNTGYAILIVLTLIGGCAFSMAGGIRVSRLITFAKTIKENVTALWTKEQSVAEPQKPKNENGSLENLSASVSIVLFIVTFVVFSIIFTTIGVSFTDALFEVGSAITTNGISMGITTVAMPIGYKWLMIAAMTIGRIEILTIIIALFSLKKINNTR